MNETQTSPMSATTTVIMRRSLAVVAGAFLVALGAQAAVPIPGNPVPVTFQVPAVLIVGGLLGPRLGAASMALYLMMGAIGVPVFAPTGVPGFARLIGPTGGYLLAYPLAAAVVGVAVANGRSWGRLAFAMVAGLVVIHSGGVAQLAILTGDVSTAVSLGSLPFLLLDVLKLVIAGAVIRLYGMTTRALL